jgi:recombination protein RecA
MFGNPETTPGGRALKFYASIRVDLRRLEQIKSGDAIIGNRVRAKVVKNKVAPPFKKAEFDIMYDEGISHVGSVLDAAQELEIIQKSGAWLSFAGSKIAQGRENAKQFLKDNPDILKQIEEQIRAKVSSQ